MARNPRRQCRTAGGAAIPLRDGALLWPARGRADARGRRGHGHRGGFPRGADQRAAVEPAFVMLAGLVGAVVIARRVDRGLGRTQVALTAYASGELARRLPVTGSGDELDRVSLSVNTVLDRLSALIETTRQITIDAAHDLKTPMTRLLHRLAEAEGSPVSEARSVLRAAATDAKQIIGTFDALLRIAEIEAGARRARFDTVDLSDVVETVADAYGPEAEQAGHRIETKIGPNLYVTGDRELLTQAFADLVENSIRHAGKGAMICLMAVSHAATVEAMVSDTGPGVP